MTLHDFEHNSALRTIAMQWDQITQLRAYAHYLSLRIQAHAMQINERHPVIAAALLDDLDDAAQIGKIEPREWDI